MLGTGSPDSNQRHALYGHTIRELSFITLDCEETRPYRDSFEHSAHVAIDLCVLLLHCPHLRSLSLRMPIPMAQIVKWWFKDDDIFLVELSPFESTSSSLHHRPPTRPSTLPMLAALHLHCMEFLPLLHFRRITRLTLSFPLSHRDLSALTTALLHCPLEELSICLYVWFKELDAAILSILAAAPTIRRLVIRQPHLNVKVLKSSITCNCTNSLTTGHAACVREFTLSSTLTSFTIA